MKTLLIALMFVQHYLLMGPIQDSILSGDFTGFGEVCTEKITVNMEDPLSLRGNYSKKIFVKEISEEFSEYRAVSIEWISKHIWEDYAVQSLNMKLRNVRSGRDEFYKLIFFMKRERKTWSLYYLRGIRL